MKTIKIQDVLNKLTDDLTHYTEVINTIPAYQGIQEFDKVWNNVKDSLTSLLDDIEKELPKEKPMGVFSFVLKGEELERYMRYKGFNEARGEVINIINSHR